MPAITKVQATAIERTRAEVVEQGKASLIVMPPSGEGEAATLSLVKMGNDGLVRWIKSEVQLSEAAGHCYTMGSGSYQTTNITAAGYDHCNRTMGVSFFLPETLAGEDNAGQRRNPEVVRDAHGSIKRVVIRCIGFGRNAIGNWQAFDSTLYYDLEPCFAQDVLKKWRPWDNKLRGPGAPEAWGKMLSSENVPHDVATDPKIKCIPVPGGYVLACKLEGPMLDVIAEHAHRVRFATRNAETIVRRNILKRFIARQQIDPKTLRVSVVGWMQPDREHVEQVARLVAEVRGGRFRIDGDEVPIEPEKTVVDDLEAERAALSGDDDGGHVAPVGETVQAVVKKATGKDQKPEFEKAYGFDVGTPIEYEKEPELIPPEPDAAAPMAPDTPGDAPPLSPELLAARTKFRDLWAKLGGDEKFRDPKHATAQCWHSLTSCGFERPGEALGTLKLDWIGQLNDALSMIDLKRTSDTLKAKLAAKDEAKEKAAAPETPDGGSKAMGEPPARPFNTRGADIPAGPPEGSV